MDSDSQWYSSLHVTFRQEYWVAIFLQGSSTQDWICGSSLADDFTTELPEACQLSLLVASLFSQTPIPQDWCSYAILSFCCHFKIKVFSPISCRSYNLALFLFLIDYLLPASQPFHHNKSRICGLQVSFHLRFWFWLYSSHVQNISSFYFVQQLLLSENKVETDWGTLFHYSHMCPSSVFPISRLCLCPPISEGLSTFCSEFHLLPFQPSDYVFLKI